MLSLGVCHPLVLAQLAAGGSGMFAWAEPGQELQAQWDVPFPGGVAGALVWRQSPPGLCVPVLGGELSACHVWCGITYTEHLHCTKWDQRMLFPSVGNRRRQGKTLSYRVGAETEASIRANLVPVLSQVRSKT